MRMKGERDRENEKGGSGGGRGDRQTVCETEKGLLFQVCKSCFLGGPLFIFYK